MMTIKSPTQIETGFSDLPSAVPQAVAGPEPTQSAHLGGVHMIVFDLVCAEREPLTARQIGQRMKLSSTEIAKVIDELCQVRLLRRLNTVIESYTRPTVASS
jgi:hypothetical protein